MPKKSNKRNKGKRTKTRKQKPILMFGCSKKNKKSCKNKVFSSLTRLSDNNGCPNCGPNCHCGPNCKCPHPCPGTCYLNRRAKKQRGGSGCGSCGCPIAPLSWNQMNKFGGGYNSYPGILNQPVMPNVKGDYQGIVGISQNGGSCSVFGPTQVMSQMGGSTSNEIPPPPPPPPPPQSGGSFYKPIGPMPGPEVGKPWSINNLPGEKGIGSDANYFKPYNTDADPQQQMSMNNSGYKTLNSMVGGYRYGKKMRSSASESSNSKKGGGLIPQDLVNLGRDFGYNFKTAYNALNGYKAPVDPAPYKGQLTGSFNNRF